MAEEIVEGDIDEKGVISIVLKLLIKIPILHFSRKGRDREKKKKYQLSGAGGTRSPPATPHCLQNRKWSSGGPKMANGDPSTPMRKGSD